MRQFVSVIGSAALAVAMTANGASAQIFASSADDVCGPATDPCVVTETVEIDSGSTLDFGLRALEIAPGGLLDFADGTSSVLCGRFLASTAADPAISVRADDGGGGDATIEARRGCSGNTTQPCLDDDDCELLTLGTCDVGTGTITLDGRVTGDAEFSASLELVAAGDIVISQRIDLGGTTSESSGGDLSVESFQGTVSANANVNAKGGGLDSGGSVVLNAAVDVLVNGDIDVRGGEFDGGSFAAEAQNDIELAGDVLADSTGGAGFGGTISLIALNELRTIGGSAGNRILLRANGGSPLEGSGADGGEITLSASSINLGQFFRAQAAGTQPDGAGGTFDLVADTAIFDGEVLMTGPGGGAGGDADMTVGALNVGATAKIDVSGGDFGGGRVFFFADDNQTMDGVIVASGSSTASPGSVALSAGLTLRVGGSILVDGDASAGSPPIRLTGCTLVLASGASVDNRSANATGGRISLSGSGFLTIEAGSTVSAVAGLGENRLTHGSEAFPPTIAGTVTPSPVVVFDDQLPGCPSCDTAADCDDSNPCSDDSCDLAIGCMNIPNAIPCDDGNACTSNDTCTSGECIGDIPAECNDSNPCTDDSCEPSGGCINTANSDPCDDASACSTDDTCIGGTCIGVPPPACNDGNPCTRDACDDIQGCVAFEEPASICLTSGKAKLLVLDKNGDNSDTFKWKWNRGQFFSLADIGAPDSTTGFAVCAYDHTSGTPSVALRLDIPAGPGWRQAGSKAWKYKDKSGTADGVQRVGVKSGADGKTLVLVLGRGTNLTLPAAVGSEQFFAADPSVVVQLRATNGACWSSSFTTPKKNTATLFKATIR